MSTKCPQPLRGDVPGTLLSYRVVNLWMHSGRSLWVPTWSGNDGYKTMLLNYMHLGCQLQRYMRRAAITLW